MTNGEAANWAPEVELSPFRALSRRQMTFPFCCQIILFSERRRIRYFHRWCPVRAYSTRIAPQ